MSFKYAKVDILQAIRRCQSFFVNNGFVPLTHIEMDKNACDTFRTRVAYHHLKASISVQEKSGFFRLCIDNKYTFK